MLLPFHFFLNVVLFPPPPSEQHIFHATVSTDFFISSSFRLFQPSQQPEGLPLFYLSVTLYLLTTIAILSPSYLYLKLLGLTSYVIWVSIRLHIAFSCRGRHLNTKLLKYNSQNAFSLFLYTERFGVSQVHT